MPISRFLRLSPKQAGGQSGKTAKKTKETSTKGHTVGIVRTVVLVLAGGLLIAGTATTQPAMNTIDQLVRAFEERLGSTG
jgi:hypothetical protein